MAGLTAWGQAPSPANTISTTEVAVTYNGTLANIVAGSEFWMQGGSVQVQTRFHRQWSVVADVAGMHAAQMNSSGVGLDMVTVTFGPRYTWRPASRRFDVFCHALLGEAWGMNSVFPGPAGSQSAANSLAVRAGGGLNLPINRRLAIRAFEADWLRTQMPNAHRNIQNNATLGTGIVARF
jgi:hypothetical protein